MCCEIDSKQTEILKKIQTNVFGFYNELSPPNQKPKAYVQCL